jgi:adhesin transport system outer membrane protein
MKYFSVKTTGVALCAGFTMTMSVNSFFFENKHLSSSWLNNYINKYPDIISANALMSFIFLAVEGSKLPLYNPELSTGYAREGKANNFAFGINQTINLWDKQAVRTAQSHYRLTAASKRFSYTFEETTAEALQALINWQSAKNKAELAFEPEEQLEALLKIVTQRQEAGDLDQVDAELTFLNLSQLLNTTAQIQVQLKQAEAQIKALLPDWTSEIQTYPELGLGVTNFQILSQWTSQHSLVLETKADPTIGLSAGQNNQENVVGVTFSMPLNIRNDYSAKAKSENQQAISAEASFRSTLRKQKFLIQANTDSLISNKHDLERWTKLMRGRGENSAKLLHKEWQVGYLNTSQYLLALQQRAQGLYAALI